MGKYYLGTGNQQINFQVVDSTGVINDLNLSGLYLSITGKAADADKLDNYDSSFFRNIGNLTGVYTGAISGKATDSELLDGLDSSYFLNGANITGTVALSGTFTGYYTGAFSGTITHTDSITFHSGLGINPDPAELTWIDDVGTMNLGLKGGNVDLRVGLQNYEYVANRNGSTLTKGTVVYVSGAQGNRPVISPAIGTADSTSAATFGILAENIASMADGYAITNGLLTNLNTTGFAEGAALYLSPTVSGAITSTKPQAPQHSVLIGFCVRSHQSAGEILVKIQNGLEFDELHDVRILNKQNNDIIRYNAPSGIWYNSDTLAINGTGANYISGDLGIGTSGPTAKLHILGADKRQIIASTTDNAALVLGQWDGATNRIESSTRKLLITSYASGISLGINGSENVHVSTSGNLGVGTTSPQFKLDVNGIASIAQSYYLNKGFADGVEEYLIRGSAGSWNGFISYTPSSSTANRGFKFGAWDNGGNRNDWVSIWNGDVGIGVTAPSQKLEVRGNIKLGGDNSGNYIYYVTDIERTIVRTTRSDVTQEGLMRSDGWGNFTFNKSIAVGYSLGSGPLTGNIYASGSVGVGTTSVSNAKLTVSSTISAAASPNYFDALNLYNQSDGGARIIASNSIGTYSAIEMGVLSSGSGTDDGVIRFSTATNGTLSTKVVIDNSGNVGVGTTSPSQKLQVVGSGTFSGDVEVGTSAGGVKAYRIYGFTAGVASNLEIQPYGNKTTIGGTFEVSGTSVFTSNVGIGAATPGYKLHIGDNTATASAHMMLDGVFGNTTAASHARIYFSDTNFGIGAGGWAASGSDDDLYLWTYDGSGRDIRFAKTLDGTSAVNTANWTTNMIIKNDGNVGIGTITPNAKLEVSASGPALGTGINTQNYLANGSSGFVGYSLRRSDDTNGGWLIGTSAVVAGDFAIYQNQGAAATPVSRLLINTSGNIGIGTTTPYDKLEVAGGIAATGYTTGSASQAHATLIGVNGGTSYLQAVDWGAEYKPLVIEGKTISLQTGTGSTSSRFYIDNGGNVGIGTTSPTEKLQVAGSANIDGSINFLRGSGEYSTYIKANDYVDGGYSGSTLRYWIELGSKGGTHIVLNTDGSAAAAENAYDHFTIWQYTNGSGAIAAGARKFWITNTGRVNFIDSTWHKSSDGIERIHFGTNGTTFYKGGGSGTIHTFRNASDVDILTLSNAKDAILSGNLAVNGTGTSTINNLSIAPTSGHVYLTGPSAAGKFITLQNGNATGGINFRDSAGNEVGSYYQVTDAWTFSKNTTISGNLTVSQNLIVNGTTTTINSTVTTIDDPIITLGGDTAPTVDDNKDRGVEFRWHNGTAAKVGFFGFDDSTGYFTFIPDATNTSEVFSGTQGDIQAANFRGTLIGSLSNALTAGSYLTGSPTSSYNGSAAVTFAVDATSANTASKVVARDASGNFSAGVITGTRLEARNSGTTQIYIDSTNNGSKEIVFQNNGATTGYVWQSGTYVGLGGGSASTSIFVTTSNGNVGVGTTDPQTTLHIVGSANAIAARIGASGQYLTVGSYTPNSAGATLGYNGTQYLGLNAFFGVLVGRTYVSNNTTAPADGMIVQGKVGIGTTSPDSFLQIKTTTAQTTIDDANQIITIENAAATDASGNLGGIRFRQINATNAANGFIGLSSTGSSSTRANLVFASPNTSGNATEKMRLTAYGTLLIGDNIDFNGGAWWNNGNAVLGKNGTDKVVVGYLGSSTLGAMIGAHNSAMTAWAGMNINGTSISFRIAEATKAVLDANGAFIQGGGTGRSTYGTTVVLNRAATFAANSDIGDGERFLSIVNDNSTTNAMATLGFRINPNGGSANAMLDMKFVNTGATSTSKLHYSFNHGGSWVDRLTIQSDGNVGVGTTTPTAAKLQISSGGISTQDSTRTFASTTFNSAIGSSDTRTLAFNGTGGSSVWWCDSGTPSFAIDSAGGTTGFWRYSSGWVQRMALNADGFGVNTTSPGVKLTTRSGTNSLPATTGTAQAGAGLRVEGGDNAVIDIGANSVDTWIQATDKSALDNYYRLLLNPRGGNVGIGVTTNPSYKLEVNGSFAATTKSFVISHPTKEGKKLRYGSLEGPENGVYVRGKTTSKVIELPDYWTKLVDPESITVQLTPIGSHQKLYVEKIEDNKVYIANENLLAKNINCFFYILAERADVEKLQVEIDA